MKRYFVLPTLAALIVLGLGAFAWLHRANLVVLNPQGPIGIQERWVIIVTFAAASIVVVPVFLLLFFFAWKYRAGNPRAKQHREPNWDHDSVLAEAIWWAVPTIIIAFLAVIAWRTAHTLDPFVPIESSVTPITVQVVALDWKWLFIYPQQGIATVNQLDIPAGTPVAFEITSDAPMNSFWIPSLGGQIMAMPGMQTQLHLMANAPGTYNGFSANISGEGFASMAFAVKSLSPNDFQTWVQSVKQQSNPLTEQEYAVLASPGGNAPVTLYSSVDPGLYTTTIMKYMAMPGSMSAMQP